MRYGRDGGWCRERRLEFRSPLAIINLVMNQDTHVLNVRGKKPWLKYIAPPRPQKFSTPITNVLTVFKARKSSWWSSLACEGSHSMFNNDVIEPHIQKDTSCRRPLVVREWNRLQSMMNLRPESLRSLMCSQFLEWPYNFGRDIWVFPKNDSEATRRLRIEILKFGGAWWCVLGYADKQ